MQTALRDGRAASRAPLEARGGQKRSRRWCFPKSPGQTLLKEGGRCSGRARPDRGPERWPQASRGPCAHRTACQDDSRPRRCTGGQPGAAHRAQTLLKNARF